MAHQRNQLDEEPTLTPVLKRTTTYTGQCTQNTKERDSLHYKLSTIEGAISSKYVFLLLQFSAFHEHQIPRIFHHSFGLDGNQV
jgi:hypothetical protein